VIRFLVRTAVMLVANALGLIVAALILKDMSINVTGFIDVHELANGHSDASGQITDDLGFSFNIQSGDGTITPITDDSGAIIAVAFNFTVTGIITDPSGGKCQASGSLFTHSD